jgi:hypothetical protein
MWISGYLHDEVTRSRNVNEILIIQSIPKLGYKLLTTLSRMLKCT